MPESPRRGRGARAGLDVDAIVGAARGIPPAEVTMQSVADALGVDRKAVHHHVTDRDNLLELLAIDAFRRQREAATPELGTSWQDACRGFARATLQTMVATGEWVPYFRFTSASDLVIVGPADVVAERMLAAGFDRETASRAMHLLVTICNGFAREVVIATREGDHPQIENLRQAFAGAPGGYPALRALIEARIDNVGQTQFAFDIDAFIVAMEHLLPASG